MSHKMKMQSWQGDIYYKPKSGIFEIEFYGWWFLSYNFSLLVQFFLVGGGGEQYVPPDPPTHLILEDQKLYFCKN